jgi:uncharacterized protein
MAPSLARVCGKFDPGRGTLLTNGKLKGATYGAVLTQLEGRQGLYTYTEKMLRGYVRMQAEANGTALSGEQPARKQAMHVGNARSGYRGPSIPRGVRTGQVVSGWDDSGS